MKTYPQKNTHLQAATSQPTKQSLQESIFSPSQEKFKNKKIPSLQKNKISSIHNPRQTSNLTDYDIMKMVGLTGQGRRRASANSTFAIGGETCFYDTFVVKESAVLRMNFCAEKPAHRKSANRCALCFLLPAEKTESPKTLEEY